MQRKFRKLWQSVVMFCMKVLKKKLLSGVLNSFYYLSRIGMYTHLCRWQVVYTKPANKEQYKGNSYDKETLKRFLFFVIVLVVEIYQITKPSDKCPSFFRVPRPIVPPRFFCPKGSKEQSKSEKYITYFYKLVDDSKD